MMRSPLFTLAVVALAVVLAAGPATAEKIKVEKADDLPRHTYAIDGKPSQLLSDDAAYEKLAAQVRKDAEAILEKYDIQDKSTLQGIYSLLQQLHFAAGDYKTSQVYLEKARELEEKEAQKLMMGTVGYAYIDALEAGEAGSEEFRTALKEGLARRMAEKPWDAIQDLVQMMSGQMQIISENLIVGMVQGQMDVAVEKSGHLSGDQARMLIGMRSTLHTVIPYKTEIGEVFSEIVAAHKEEEKPNIWPDREVAFTGDEGYATVVVGVWDSGVDTEVFGERNYVNAAEVVDGKDTDGNGYIDDVHGIAFDLDAKPTPELLYSLGDQTERRDELEAQIKGFTDLTAAIDSDEAASLRKKMASLGTDETKPFMENLNLYAHHSHGTHVAGIALEGNPYARVLTARLSFDHRMIPKAYTPERAKGFAEACKRSVEYFKEHGVRVVNMSWGLSIDEFENNLEANGIGENAEERAAMAREMFKTVRDGLYEAIAGAEDILFVAAAGNSDNDVEFDEFIPSGFDLPNLIVAGAVDQAGDETSFTSIGRTVVIYSNGFEVESYVPGGDRIAFSGTSMASPNVCNLAGKLISRDPSLSPPEVVRLIVEGADNMGDEKPLPVMNPKRSLELLGERHHSSP